MTERILYNLLQIFVVIAFAPLVEGVTTRLKENLQSKSGPSIFQPYSDLRKLLHKDELVSEHSSWIFRAAPYVAFASPVFVALLIPDADAISAVLRVHGRHARRWLHPGARRLLRRAGRGGHRQPLRANGRQPHPHGRLPCRAGLHRGVPDGVVRGRLDHPLHRTATLDLPHRQHLRAVAMSS